MDRTDGLEEVGATHNQRHNDARGPLASSFTRSVVCIDVVRHATPANDTRFLLRTSVALHGLLLMSIALGGHGCSRSNESDFLLRGRFQSNGRTSFAGGQASCFRALDWARYDSVIASQHGSFMLRVPGKGVYKFVFSALRHPDLVIPLYIERSLELRIDLPDDSTSTPQIAFVDTISHSARLYGIYSEMSSYRPDQVGHNARSRSATKAENATALAQYVQRLEQQVSIESDSILRQALLIARLAAFSYGDTISPVIARSILRQISPTHPYWSFAPFHLTNSALYADSVRYLDVAIEYHPDSTTRAWLMLSSLPSRINTADSAKVRAYAARLVSEFPQTGFAALASRFLDMSALEPVVGAPMPPFSFEILEHSGDHIRGEELKGKTYLLCFWATWCPHCLDQIQFLTRAFDEYKNKGLQIISVSLDDDPQKARAFLRAKTTISWLQSYAPGAFNNEFVKRLGIRSLPAEYLVDQEGRLLASSERLFGNNLEPTLSKVWIH